MSRPQDAFLSLADTLGTRLVRDAIWYGAMCNWTGDVMAFQSGQWQVSHSAMGGDLYGGTSGVAIFLARLHAATRERLFAKVAVAAMEQAVSQAAQLPPTANCGFYAGRLGIAWALIQVGHIVDASRLVQKGWDLLRTVAESPLADQGLDMTSGSAGAICALLDLAQLSGMGATEREALIDMARPHGQRLIDRAKRSDRGWCWSPEAAPNQSQGLCGLSHGASGMAWALLKLHEASGDTAFLNASSEAVRYERSWFSSAEGNWPDLRSLYDPSLGDGKRLTYMSAWCHGAPGVGLARLASYTVMGDEALLHEARAAIRSTTVGLRLALSTGQGNFSLCHGLAGNADLLIEATRLLGEPEHLQLAQQLGLLGQTLYASTDAPWPCGVLNGGETPALMLGVAGIGYFYLRLANPSTPSMLLMPSAATRISANTDDGVCTAVSA